MQKLQGRNVQAKASTQPTPPPLEINRVQSFSMLEQVQIAKAKKEKTKPTADSPADHQRIQLARDSQKAAITSEPSPQQPCWHTPKVQQNLATAATPDFGEVVTHTSIATPELGCHSPMQAQAKIVHAADPLAWLEHEPSPKVDLQRMLNEALLPVLARLDAQEKCSQGLRCALEATMKRATDSEATCKRLEDKLHSIEASSFEARERSLQAIDKIAAVELMTAQEMQQLQEVANVMVGKCQEADRAASEASAARADLRAAELGFEEAVEECKGVMVGLKGQVRDQLARMAEKGETAAAAATAASAAGAAALANSRMGQLEGALQTMQCKLHELETTIIAVEQSTVFDAHQPTVFPPLGNTPIRTPMDGAAPQQAPQKQDFDHLRGHVVGLAVKVTDIESQLRAFTLARVCSETIDKEQVSSPPSRRPEEQRVVQLEEATERLNRKVDDIEAELRHVTTIANLQEVVATQLVRDAHDTMQANRGRNMVIFDPPPAPAGYDKLPADRKASTRKEQAVDLCVKVQSAYEEQEKGKTPDKAAIRRYYELAIASTAEFFTRPSKTALPDLAHAPQRNLVVSFTSQQGKIGFLSMNGALLKGEVIAKKKIGGDAASGVENEKTGRHGAAIRATHDLTVAERTAKQALTMAMMDLRTSGKRTAVGAHRGQAVLFVFHAGEGKQRDVYVWDSVKGKAACMLRGIGEDDWKQFVRTERPFPSRPCGYLGYDERPQQQRGFSDRPSHKAKPQARLDDPREDRGRKDTAVRRQGQEGEQRRRGGQRTLAAWVRKDTQGRGAEGKKRREGQAGGARRPSKC